MLNNRLIIFNLINSRLRNHNIFVIQPYFLPFSYCIGNRDGRGEKQYFINSYDFPVYRKILAKDISGIRFLIHLSCKINSHDLSNHRIWPNCSEEEKSNRHAVVSFYIFSNCAKTQKVTNHYKWSARHIFDHTVWLYTWKWLQHDLPHCYICIFKGMIVE